MFNVVDSSGWLEYFADTKNAAFFAPAIENTSHLIVPSICILEVFKRVLTQREENAALHAIAFMQQGRVIDLNPVLAIKAAKISATLKLPLADSVVLATSLNYQATLWTQDSDFKDIQGVRYLAKHK